MIPPVRAFELVSYAGAPLPEEAGHSFTQSVSGLAPQQQPPAAGVRTYLAEFRGHPRLLAPQNAATNPWPTPPRTPPTEFSSKGDVLLPHVHGALTNGLPGQEAPHMLPQLPSVAAAGENHLQVQQGTGPVVRLNAEEALFVYGPALRMLGFTQEMLEKLVGLPDGSWLLADLSQNLLLLRECGFTNEDVYAAVQQASGPLNMQILGQYAPILRRLGWPKDDILSMAKAHHGAQSLAELSLHAPELLRRGFLHKVLATCALTPGALQLLTVSPMPLGQAPFVGGAVAQNSGYGANDAFDQLPNDGGHVIVPIEFSATELHGLRNCPRGAARVSALSKFNGRLDNARIDKRSLLALARGPSGVNDLKLAHLLAPSFAIFDIDLADIFAVLMCRGGSLTLRTLYHLSSALRALNFDAATQVRMAARDNRSTWLEALKSHAANVYSMGWTQQDLLDLANLPDAPKSLEVVRSKGPLLHSMGFSKAHLLGMLSRGNAIKFLSAAATYAPGLLQNGFSLDQVERVIGAKAHDLALLRLQDTAATLISFGFDSALLTQMAVNGAGARAYKNLHNCCTQHTRDMIPFFVLIRAALLPGSEHYLATIGQFWMRFRAVQADAPNALYNAMSHRHTPASFKRWIIARLAEPTQVEVPVRAR